MSTKAFLFLGLALLMALAAGPGRAQETERQYLSGLGKDDGVPWDFFCTAGKRGGQQTTIPVPSNWELQGFGKFTYGEFVKGMPPPIEGRYHRTFSVPAAWSSRRVFLVFEGVMTDTEASVNGQSAGPMHQGGYTQFRYEVTKLVKFGADNRLDVTVQDESADPSVNNAERRGDYWNYAGIYRPVYLEAVPADFIARTAINAGADGHLTADVFTDGAAAGDTVEGQVQTTDGQPVGPAFSAPVGADNQTAHLDTRVAGPKLWTAETPSLYRLQVRLMRGGTPLHVIRQPFGFRTIELRPGDGIYVNGRRVLLKGCCRHTFWPDSGRCTSEAVSRSDIQLMKDMNMNAVRMSHYPPDQHFLDDCDKMGLYVLDELPGWQHAYAAPTAHRMVQEMVTRDVNHPCILFWDNGNEGGWNRAVDDDFALWDPQARHIIHPGGGTFRDITDSHYPNYANLQRQAAGDTVFMPTEFLHAIYDGGAGSGLSDYWDVVRHSKVAGGGFIWAFLDEDVKRVDLDGQLDSHGDNAPDGILGPYREKEGSFLTIKAVWSPLIIPQPALPASFDGTLPLENRYDFTDARQCRFTWQLRRFPRPAEGKSGFTVTAQGTATPTDAIPPGASGTLTLAGLPRDRRGADALAVRADDPSGHEVWTWVWPLAPLDTYRQAAATPPSRAAVTATETPADIRVHAGTLTATFSKTTGQLLGVQRGGQSFSLTNGPRPAAGAAMLVSLDHHADGGDYVIKATYSGDMQSVQWRIHRTGWITVHYAYAQDGPHDFFGVSFDYPEADVKSMRWLGDGPYHAWQNRREGGTLNVWENAYNDTITGDTLWIYPEFKGYYADVRWIQLQTTEGPITAIVHQDDLAVQVLVPKFPTTGGARNVSPPFPAASLSFLDAIPAMGSKFAKAVDSGPHSQPAVAAGPYSATVDFYFGPLPR